MDLHVTLKLTALELQLGTELRPIVQLNLGRCPSLKHTFFFFHTHTPSVLLNQSMLL